MPIRFRCAYCNQLLGIAKRKAGSVVRCPTCAGQVVVPNVEIEDVDEPSGAGEPFVFERNDFDDLLREGPSVARPNDKGPMAAAAKPVAVSEAENPLPGAWGTHSEPPFDVERIHPSAMNRGAAGTTGKVFVSASRRKVAIAIMAVALMAAFVAGIFVGIYLHREANGRDDGKQSHRKFPVGPHAVQTAPRAGPSARPAMAQANQDPVEGGQVDRKYRDFSKREVAQA